MKPGPEADKLYIAHMLECIDRIMEYTGQDEERFRSSRLIQDAVIRNLQTMAESSQRLSPETLANAPDVSWRALSGFRNILVHDYLGVDLNIIWQVVMAELPPLRSALLRLDAEQAP